MDDLRDGSGVREAGRRDPVEDLFAPGAAPGLPYAPGDGSRPIVAVPVTVLPAYSHRHRSSRRHVVVSVLLAVAAVAVLVPTVLHILRTPTTWSGTLEPATRVDLTFPAAGTILQLLVKPGDHVTKGQLLAQQDDANISLALSAGKSALAEDQARLAALEQSVPAGGGTTTTTASPATAQASQQAQQAASEAVQAAESGVAAAQARLNDSQANASQDQSGFVASCPEGASGPLAAGRPAGTPGCAAQSDQLTRDNQAIKAEQLNLKHEQDLLQQATDSATHSQTLAANASLTEALAASNQQAGLLQEVDSVLGQIADEERSLATEQGAENDTQLVAPIDGIVANANGVPGDFADPNGVRVYSARATQSGSSFSLLPRSPGSSGTQASTFLPVVQLYGTNGWLVVAEVGERDALGLKPGQAAHVVVVGLGGHRYPAHVSQVIEAPLQAGSNGVAYQVVLQLGTLPSKVLPGLSVAVSFGK